jgi:outer membrane protein OmpA-like peptidoglycan-associated protein
MLSLEEKLKDAKIGDKIIMKALNFQPGLAILLPESLPILNELGRQMINNKSLIIEIQGHICYTTNDYEDLSTDRSKSVYDFLISKGISKNRMTYVGFGVTNPLFKIPENNETEQISNRRVEIKIISL